MSNRGGRGGRGSGHGGEFRGRGGGRGGGRGFISAGGDRGAHQRFESTRGGYAGGSSQSFPACETHKIIAKSAFPVGTSGKNINLVANYFKVNVEEIVVFKHDFNISFAQTRGNGEKISPADNERLQKYLSSVVPLVFETFTRQQSGSFKDILYIYDNGNNFYATQNLEPNLQSAENIEVNIDGQTKQFKVKVKMVQRIDLSAIHQFYQEKTTSEIHQTVVHFIESLFRQLSAQKYAVYHRNFFDATNLIPGSKNWINFTRGFTNACRITEIGLSLNIHLKTGSMISPSVDTLEQMVLMVTEGQKIQDLRPGQILAVNKIIKGLKVFTTHLGRKSVYTIKALSSKKPKESTFDTKDAAGQTKTISVHDYFKEKYKITVKDYPLVSVIGKGNLNIPLELCKMVDKQFLNTTKLDATIQNDLLQTATQKPIQYFSNLVNYTNELSKSNPALMKNFGTNLSPKPLSFYGRVLNTPKQHASQRKDPFYQVPVRKPKWAFISLDRNFPNREIERFVQDLQNCGQRYGIDFFNCCRKAQIQLQGDEYSMVSNIFNQLQSLACQIIFIVLPSNGETLYGYIKHWGDQRLGTVTQCLNGSKALNRKGGYVENILLKVNGKLGGKNSAVHEDEFKQIPLNYAKTMVIGVDVNHPGQVEKVESSIAAAVGSYDNQFTMYSVSLRVLEKNHWDFIDGIGGMIEELLAAYRKLKGYFPETLVVFRDGVADGQYAYAENEIKDIKKSFHKNVKNGKVIYISMQKGHHTRFVLAQPDSSSGRPTQNVPSGTIVDHTIVEPSQHMFFLNSHFSQLGTSRPMKYVVLYNDFEQRVLSTDALQKFCFYCCHGCARFRGPIALPVPIRYADLCAYRSKVHLETVVKQFRSADSKGDQKTLEQRVIQRLNTLVKLNEKIKNSLYYA